MPFSLVIARRPPSASSRGGRLRFQADLRQLAQAGMAGRATLQGRVYCRISWFHTRPTTQDVDNIAKGILDGMKAVVFADDVSVVRCLLSKIDETQPYRFEPSVVGSVEYNAIQALLAAGHEHVLAIEVGEVGTPEVGFGSIEGDKP